MKQITFSNVQNANEIEILRNRSGKYNDFTYTYEEPTLDLLKKNFSLPDSLYLIAKKDDEFVAFCSIDKDWWEDGYFMIREIIVAPNFQKQGIGETSMGKCIDHAKNKGAIGVVTETAFENLPMQKLCAKFHLQKWDNPQWKEGITYKLIF
jgi:predicted N-acetyltransferase YhbS